MEPADAERESTYFLSANRNKKSITLDLKAEDGRATLESLVRRADVLMENFRTGVLDRLGFTTERLADLNPRLVVLSISGFGHDGPEGGRAGYDQIAQGEAGLMSLTGPNPDDVQRVGVPIADLLAGMYGGAFGVVAALQERERTGRGAASCERRCWPASSACTPSRGRSGPSPARSARRRATTIPRSRPTGCSAPPTAPSRSPSAAKDCGSGSARASTSIRTPPEWPRIPNASRTTSRSWNWSRMRSARTPATNFSSNSTASGVPAGRVRTISEVYEWEQTKSQGLLVDVDHHTLGNITLPGPPLRFFEPDGTEVTETRHTAPPVLGADNDTVLSWLKECS